MRELSMHRAALSLALAATAGAATASATAVSDYYGTLEPFASNAIYFVVTDRFVNGDTGNDYRDQGGANRSFDRPMRCPDGISGNLGYVGGDFRGLLDNADYIKAMGFGAVWITPIIDNPDAAFTGGEKPSCTSILTDQGKSGYHGYWGINFYRVDEHWPSPGLGFAELTAGLRAHGLKTVLDIVGNHGSPAWSMPMPQPGFGQIFDVNGKLLADHQNLPPNKLDPKSNPLHRFYNTSPDLAQLADLDPNNPAVMDYLVGAYLQWIDQGADAFRVDTISHQPLAFWKEFSRRIRERHPGFYMFGEAFDYDAARIAPFTWPENGGISVLDFPQKALLLDVFQKPGGDYGKLKNLHTDDGIYQNAYELATFYDNHDMARFNGRDLDFIDIHNWLFTARGIPVVYYGSETGFMRGRVEHAGNRNYFGQARIDAARDNPIRVHLARIATVRAASPALQRGLQLDLEMGGDRAAFLRVYQHAGVAQTALVLLNKGDRPAKFNLGNDLPPGEWRSGFDAKVALTVSNSRPHAFDVAPHDVAVWLLEAPIKASRLSTRLDQLMSRRERRRSGE